MAWREITVEIDDVAAALDRIASGLQYPWIIVPPDTGIIDPDSLYIDIISYLDGEAIRQKVYMLFDFTSDPTPDTGWDQAIVDYGSVAPQMGSVNLSTLKRDTYGVRQGNTFKRRMLLVWK